MIPGLVNLRDIRKKMFLAPMEAASFIFLQKKIKIQRTAGEVSQRNQHSVAPENLH